MSTEAPVRPRVLPEPSRNAPPASRPPHRRSPTSWSTLGWLVGAHLAALAGLHVLLREAWWWWVAAALTAVVMFGTAIARRLVSGWIAPAIGAAVAFGVLTLGFAADTAILGVVPTADTWTRFSELAVAGWQSIAEQRIPATPVIGIVFLISVLVLLLAVLAELLVVGSRTPAWGILPALVILGVPVAIRAGVANPLVYALTAICLLALLRVRRPRTSARAAIAVGAPVVIASLLAPGLLPEIDESPAVGAGFASGLNPLITLGDDLRRGAPITAVTYTSGAGPLYLRLAVLNEFTGRTWMPDVEASEEGGSVEAFPAPPGLDPDVARGEFEARIQLHGVSGRWLPLPYPATSVTGLDGEWMWDPEGLAVRSAEGDTLGQTYDVEFLQVTPTQEQLRTAGDPGDAVADELIIPDDLPETITETASVVTAGSSSDYDRALALQSYLRGPDFVYSVDTPVEDGYDGSGVDVLATFLEERAGYCIHFASAMAVMARTLDIPSRIAVGFQPGTATTVEGRTIHTVSTHDLHAWPELYFDGVGWTRFEPTPGRGSVPSFPEERVDDPQAPRPAEPEEPAAAPTPRSSPTPGAVGPGLEIDDSPAGVAARANIAAIVGGAVALAVALVLLVPALARVGVRWWRLRRIRTGDRAAEAAWAELRDTARDHGWSAPESETPRVFSERLEIVLGADRDAVARVRAQVESSAFGPAGGGVDARGVHDVRRAIARAGSPRDRLRAVFLPASLLARFTARDLAA